jgi:hypothetical protein
MIEEPSGVQAMAFSANGRFLATGLQSGAVLIRSVKACYGVNRAIPAVAECLGVLIMLILSIGAQ